MSDIIKKFLTYIDDLATQIRVVNSKVKPIVELTQAVSSLANRVTTLENNKSYPPAQKILILTTWNMKYKID